MSALDNLKRQRLGMAGYVPLLAAMPGTIVEIGERTGVCQTTAYKLVREFHRLGIVHRSGLVPGKLRSTPRPIWSSGPGVDVPVKRERRARVVRPQVIAFASVIKALAEPRTIAELSDETGVCRGVISAIVKALRARRLSHVGEWERRHGCPIARHVWGRGGDARRPRVQTKRELNARHNPASVAKRRMLRLIRATAGNDARFAPQAVA